MIQRFTLHYADKLHIKVNSYTSQLSLKLKHQDIFSKTKNIHCFLVLRKILHAAVINIYFFLNNFKVTYSLFSNVHHIKASNCTFYLSYDALVEL